MRNKILLLVIVAVSFLPLNAGADEPIRYLERKPFDVVRTDVVGRNEPIASLMLEMADDPGEHATGLMHRRALLDRHGMMFVFKTPSRPSFWMKNVHVPLDLVFINKRGRIIDIHPNARPGDETSIPAPGLILAVIEIAGGSARAQGLRVGDEIQPWPPLNRLADGPGNQ